MGSQNRKTVGLSPAFQASFLVTLAMAVVAAIAFFFWRVPGGEGPAYGMGEGVFEAINARPTPKSSNIDMTQARVVVNPGGVEFTAPEPGTYELAKIRPAVDGRVVDVMGQDRTLFEVLDGKIGLVSFIYTRCGDEDGCPLAVSSFYEVENLIQKRPALRDRVKMITLSFDPQNDTPDVMADFANVHASDTVDHSLHFHTLEARYGTEQAREMAKLLGEQAICRVAEKDADGDWQIQVGTTDQLWTFLTTRSEAELMPILDGYGQYIIKDIDEDGNQTGTFSHVLKVYLIDSSRMVRNIYSTSFLYPELVLSDLESLLLEEEHSASNVVR